MKKTKRVRAHEYYCHGCVWYTDNGPHCHRCKRDVSVTRIHASLDKIERVMAMLRKQRKLRVVR